MKRRISRAITNFELKAKPEHNCGDTVKLPSKVSDEEHGVHHSPPRQVFVLSSRGH